MNKTNYFCCKCFKIYTEYYQSGIFYLDKKRTKIIPHDHALKTGFCICGGKLEID